MLFNKKQRTKIADLVVEEKEVSEMTDISTQQTRLIVGGLMNDCTCCCCDCCR